MDHIDKLLNHDNPLQALVTNAIANLGHHITTHRDNGKTETLIHDHYLDQYCIHRQYLNADKAQHTALHHTINYVQRLQNDTVTKTTTKTYSEQQN
jgi:hypothetical protein